MIAILKHHDDAIHFDPLDREDQEERKRSQQWVEGRTCREWCGGFLCVDGTPFNLFQKPGWHGEGFFDKNSNYSLTAQVVILPHNLRIVDYVIGVPGSLRDSNVFGRTRVARNPDDFFGVNQWLWADSAYASQVWCVTPFKRLPGGALTRDQKTFNYRLSKVRVRSEHFFGSIKGRFQSL
ncbi:hypothetical protein BDR05DRAFT_1035276 [Suillus weaverae]|nr:hypothetical protein BDR05DRAFT_1035276 [Suillus weaverae]